AKAIEHSVPPESIIIEIPEAVVSAEASEVLETLTQLHRRGFGIAIDDYGTGPCTRQQLARVPANELKLDRKMLAGAARRPTLRAALIESLDRSEERRVGNGGRC